MLRIALALTLAAGVAHADGAYFSQALGTGTATGELSTMVGRTVRTRASIGARVRWLALESWISADTQPDREGAWGGFLGGDPVAGRADLESYGVDIKLIAPLHRTADLTVEGYVRGGGNIVSASGVLEGYRGHGFGAAGGFQLQGKVRALGFLWGPLFFLKRGPKLVGALYVEHGYELVELRMASERPIAARISHLTMGFGVGTSF